LPFQRPMFPSIFFNPLLPTHLCFYASI
jgi:hypothetical protein